jgi:hypothetical protein
MNGPSATYSADILRLLDQSLGPAPKAATPAPAGPLSFEAQAGAALGVAPTGPPPASVIDNSFLAKQPFAIAPPPAPKGAPPAAAPPPAAGPAPAPMQAPTGPAGPPAPPPTARFVAQAGGSSPAREAELLGPRMRGALEEQHVAKQAAIDAVAARAQQTSAQEFAVALDQERQARVRQDAAEFVAAERQDELAMLQADFDQSVRHLSQMKLDPNRGWTNKSAGQKVAGFISIFLGGMLQGMRGGPNVGLEMINREIDREVDAQKFDFDTAKNVASLKGNAYAMAMQKWQNADAARAVARAAALDAVQAQIGQVSAMWKGADAVNRRDMAQAALADEKLNQFNQFYRFIPAMGGAARIIDRETGAIYTQAEWNARVQRGEVQDFELKKQGIGIAGDMLKAGAHQDDEGASKIASALQGAGVPQARSSAEQALRALNVSEGGKLEAVARWGLGETLSRAVLSEDANAREQAYQAFANASMKAMMGNVTASEEERARKQLGSASDPASRRRAIASTLEMLSEIEKNAKAGESPGAQRKFDEHRAAAQGSPPNAPKGSKAGW